VDAASAIAELKELSTQIEAVVVASRDGSVEAATLSDDAAGRVAAAAQSLLEGADQLRRDLGRENLSQLQASTPDGSVFVVVDAERVAVATTGADPTVGLVFYDLKTLLRQVAGDANGGPPADDGGAAEEVTDEQA
jgi:predicted regulator of Ras-like GTPase activity (Roadblock/LC7/MglB family)